MAFTSAGLRPAVVEALEHRAEFRVAKAEGCCRQARPIDGDQQRPVEINPTKVRRVKGGELSKPQSRNHPNLVTAPVSTSYGHAFATS